MTRLTRVVKSFKSALLINNYCVKFAVINAITIVYNIISHNTWIQYVNKIKRYPDKYWPLFNGICVTGAFEANFKHHLGFGRLSCKHSQFPMLHALHNMKLQHVLYKETTVSRAVWFLPRPYIIIM